MATHKARKRGAPPILTSGTAALSVVPEHVEVEPTGDPHLTQEAVASWGAGQRKCRARRRHNWGPYTVYEHRNYYDVVEVCSHCRNRRSADFIVTARGIRQATKWQADYRDGYLLPKGAARLDEDFRDELVASDILSRKMVEVTDDE